jgi:hypothetical protein
VGERELERRRLQRHAVALADRSEPPGALDERRRREAVVVGRARPRIGEDPAVEDAAEDHGDAALEAEG